MHRILHALVRRVPFLKVLLEELAQLECRLSRHWVSAAHRRLRAVQWTLPPQPEHFDHHIDLYHQWLADGRSYWVERGAFGGLVIRNGDTLELACGDGFNARNFYAPRSKRVVACDFDPTAIATARRKNQAPNVEYILADIRTSMPAGQFDNIFWDAAIEHFTEEEIAGVMESIKARIKPGGVLSGYTLVEREDKVKHLSHHEYEFKDKADLMRFLTPHFKNVTVFETRFPDRHNLYFWASDGVIPFQPGSPTHISSHEHDSAGSGRSKADLVGG